MYYQGLLDDLFDLWERESIEKGFGGFCRDGLMNKGVINSCIGEDGKTYWYRDRGNENELWKQAPMRVMFLNKDSNRNPNQDSREWLLRQHSTDITCRFYTNISLWFYGILHMNQKGEYPIFEEICNPSVYSSFIDNNPVSIVNCKKESGVSTIKNGVLNKHISLFDHYLVIEISILNPDIIVCGGGSSSIKNFVESQVYTLERFNSWIYYSTESNKIVIDSFHPSYFGLTMKDIYTKMMEAYKSFVLEKPCFIRAK